MKQPYTVTIERLSRHTYFIEDCNSPEEAEAIAEENFSSGDDGNVETIDSEVVDCYPEGPETD